MARNWKQAQLIGVLCFAVTTTFSIAVWAEGVQGESAAVRGGEHQAALAYFQGLADKGDPVGHYYLASMYAEGKGVVHHPKKAAQLYTLAAEKGYVPAQFALGEAYATGKGGTPKDYAMAAKWWERAAKQGHVEAQYQLARLYHDGLGVRRNKDAALKWQRKAAEQGHPEAQKIIAMLDVRDTQAVAGRNAAPESGQVAATVQTGAGDGGLPVTIETPAAVAAAEIESTPETAPAAADNAEAIALIDQTLRDAPAAAGVNREAWIMSQPGDNYAIQIFFERSEDKVLEFMNQLGPAEDRAYFHTQHEGKDYIAVVYGSFPSYSQARGVLGELPDSVKKNLPWIREYSQIKRSLASVVASQ